MPFHLQFWLFRGIERASKKRFVIALKTEDYDPLQRSAALHLPLIEKFIRKGWIIVSDCWRAYNSLSEYVYVHDAVNHSEKLCRPTR